MTAPLSELVVVSLLETPDLLPSAGEDVALLVSRVVLVSVSVVPVMRTRKQTLRW